MGAVHFLIVCIITLVYIVPVWRIATKAGFPGVLSLLMLVPLLNLILIWVFAFIEWPIERSQDQQNQ